MDRASNVMVRAAGLMLLAAAIATHAHGAPAPDLTGDQYYHLALEAQSARDFPEMLRLLRRSAEADHRPAQEMLGMVLLGGPQLYGRSVRSDLCEASDWMRRALAQDSAIAKFQLTFVNRLMQARSAGGSCGPRERISSAPPRVSDTR